MGPQSLARAQAAQDRKFDETCAILTATTTTGKYGPDRGWGSPGGSIDCHGTPVSDVEALEVERRARTQYVRLVMPAGTAVTMADQITYRGKTWNVVGGPGPQTNIRVSVLIAREETTSAR